MKVILLKELKGRGGEGDVIEVARGFANNYLFRQGYAEPATKGNLKQLEARRANIAKREEVRIDNAQELREKLNDAKVKVEAQIGEEGQLFGSITNATIADAIADQLNIELDRRRIDVGKAIKEAGAHAVSVSLYRDIKAEVTVLVGNETVGYGEKKSKKSEKEPEGASAEVEEGSEAAASDAKETENTENSDVTDKEPKEENSTS